MEARAEVVGSLLRPPALLAARDALERGELSHAAFKRIEDEAVDDALRLQEEAGLDVVTDGEMRRLSFQAQLPEAVEGFGEWNLDAFLWGEWRSDEVGDLRVERPPLAVTGRLRRRRFLSAEEFAYARGRTEKLLKVTLPSPSLFANFWDPDRSRSAYARLDDFLADVAEILREEADELDNHVIGSRPGVTFGLHLCRGNQASRWLVSGGYDWLAERIFPAVRADRLLLEYDDERSGGFDPLAALPHDKTAVLGLVTTKTPRRETVEGLTARIREASRFVPLERLALSPQCGFGTSVVGNALSPEDQRAKLETVTQTAAAVWPGA